MSIPGYAGNILYVDLTTSGVTKEPLDPEVAKTFVGGAGINNKLAYDLIAPDVEPLSPENAIIVGTGPFNGTMIPGSSEVMIVYKSPLNGTFPYSNGGGHFSHMLKSSGYDHIVITGRAARPTYLKIADGEAELCDASDLWGKDIFETVDLLRSRYEPCSIIPIGQAGENLVSISVTTIDKGGTVGSGGLPAVMGSKNLKAMVAVQGTREVRVADYRRLQRLVDQLLGRIKAYPPREEMLVGGSMAMTKDWAGAGLIRKINTELEMLPENYREIRDKIYEIHKRSRKGIACPTCPMGDKDRIDLVEGVSANLKTYDSAVMTLVAMGHNVDNALEGYLDVLREIDLTNRYGIDRLYGFNGLFDIMATLYEWGVISKEDVGGLELRRDFDTRLKLIEMITFRQGIGDILADGIVKAAPRIGRGVEKYITNMVKGQPAISDPRANGLGTFEFAQLTYPGRCLTSPGGFGAPSYNPNFPKEQWLKQVPRFSIPEEAQARIFGADPFNVGRLTRYAEDFFSLFNVLGQCHRLYISRFYDMNVLAELYSAVTGIETTPRELLQAGERAWNLWKIINLRAGFGREADNPPEVWFTPLKGKDVDFVLTDRFRTEQLTREDIGNLLGDYYEERGWDRKTGVPTSWKLKELGLEGFTW